MEVIKRKMVFIIMLCLSINVFANGKELIFSDSFDKGISQQNWKFHSHVWKVENGNLVNTGFGGSAVLKKDIGENFIVEAKIKMIAVDPKGAGFTGIGVAGVMFDITPQRFWAQYRKPGEKRGSAARIIKNNITLQMNTWYQYKIIHRSSGLFQWYVNGVKISEFIEPSMKGNINLHGWRIKAAYDDIKVYKINEKESKETINLIRNSSFEILRDTLPAYWTPNANIPLMYPTVEDFHKNWFVDNKEKYEGKYSLHIAPMGVRGWKSNIEKGKPYTFSIYMKSPEENTEVELYLWEYAGKTHFKKVKVGKQWQRFSITIKNPVKFILYPGIRIRKGYVWLDAAQLEEGEKPTDYKRSIFDSSSKSKIVFNPRDYVIPFLKTPPSLDGVLSDKCWKKSLKLSDFTVPTGIPGKFKKPKDKTEAYIFYNENNLYIGVKC